MPKQSAAVSPAKSAGKSANAMRSRDNSPRWPAVIALLAVGGMAFALPDSLSPGPRWLQLAILGLLTIPNIVARRVGSYKVNQYLGYALSSVVTTELIWSLGLLVVALPSHKEAPVAMLRSAAILWATNVIVFASWYWRLDAGGPNARDLRDAHTEGAFLFPQMTIDEMKTPTGARGWSPDFVDYLFLAFNTSTAFSPTDVPVLSRWAKLLMMTQSCISLSTITLLAARAVNIL